VQQPRPKEMMPVVDCDHFKRNPDGSWTTVRHTRMINPAGYELMIPSKMTFPQGKGLETMGFDVAKYLEEHCK